MTSFQAALPGKPTQMSPNRAADPTVLYMSSERTEGTYRVKVKAIMIQPTPMKSQPAPVITHPRGPHCFLCYESGGSGSRANSRISRCRKRMLPKPRLTKTMPPMKNTCKCMTETYRIAEGASRT